MTGFAPVMTGFAPVMTAFAPVMTGFDPHVIPRREGRPRSAFDGKT